MTIEQKAREIAATIEGEHDADWLYTDEVVQAARLGIIEGRRQAFEEAAKRVEACAAVPMDDPQGYLAKIIRALIGEQEV